MAHANSTSPEHDERAAFFEYLNNLRHASTCTENVYRRETYSTAMQALGINVYPISCPDHASVICDGYLVKSAVPRNTLHEQWVVVSKRGCVFLAWITREQAFRWTTSATGLLPELSKIMHFPETDSFYPLREGFLPPPSKTLFQPATWK